MGGIIALLDPRLWGAALAIALASGIGGYVKGCAQGERALAAYQAKADQAARVESEANRLRERALTIANDGVAHAHAMEKKRLAAAAADAGRRLRDLETAIASGPARDDPAASPRTDDDPRDTIIGECARALFEVDQHAQGLAATLAGLQRYTSEVCLAPR